jgi:hypothetical protein
MNVLETCLPASLHSTGDSCRSLPHPLVLSDGQKNTFKRLNQIKDFSTFSFIIRQTLGEISFFIKNIFTNSDAWAIDLSAEHMSQGLLSGNTPSSATAATIDLCKRVEGFPSDITKALEYALSIQKKIPFISLKLLISLLSIAKHVCQDVQTLKPGQSIAIPSNVFQHSMIMMITCIREDGGEKKYRVVQFNTGYGSGQYHHRRINGQGKLQYQTGLVFDNVSEKSLCGDRSTFFRDLFSLSGLGSVHTLYTKVLTLLDGTIAPPSSDERLWSHGQLGGSCTTSCCLALIRANTEKDQYKRLRAQGRTEFLLKAYRQIKGGWAPLHITRTALETLKKLQAQRIGGDELVEARYQIEQQLIRATKLTFKSIFLRAIWTFLACILHRQKHDSRVSTANTGLAKAFTRIRKGIYSQKHYISVAKSIALAMEKMSKTPIQPPSDNERKQIQKTVDAMVRFVHQSPALTRDEIYLLTFVFSSVKLMQNQGLKLQCKKEFNNGFNKIYSDFNAIDKRELYDWTRLNLSSRRFVLQ